MSLSDLASLGSFVSGIAVLISLIYVAIQIRQTERNQRTLLQQETSSRNIEAIKHWAEASVASALMKAIAGDTNLTALDIYALEIQLRMSLTSAQDTFMLHKQSMIDEIQLEGGLRSLRYLFAFPVLRAMWNVSRQTYSPEFAQWFDAHTKDVPLHEPVDSVERLRVALADLRVVTPK